MNNQEVRLQLFSVGRLQILHQGLHTLDVPPIYQRGIINAIYLACNKGLPRDWGIHVRANGSRWIINSTVAELKMHERIRTRLPNDPFITSVQFTVSGNGGGIVGGLNGARIASLEVDIFSLRRYAKPRYVDFTLEMIVPSD